VWRSPEEHAYKLIRPDANPDADPDHPFYGRVIVFTGTLMSRTRQMAWDDVVKVGGIPELNVTKRTNVLVIGDINPAVAPGMITTGKAAKVFALRASNSRPTRRTRDGDFYLATSENLHLATHGDFLMATNTVGLGNL